MKPETYLPKEKYLDFIVNEASRLTMLEGMFIGIAGAPSTQKDYVKEFGRFGDTAALVALTSHDHPIVRLTAFEALIDKEYPSCVSILKQHITDCETYQFFAGCLITDEPVNLSMYFAIEDRLSMEERLFFKSAIREVLKRENISGVHFLD